MYLQNKEFSQELKNKLLVIYTESWPGVYFKLTPQETNQGHVTFYETYKNPPKTVHLTPTENVRFKVEFCMPEKTRIYFMPRELWAGLDNPTTFYPVEKISHVKHAILFQGFNYTKSPYYTTPYTLCFKNRPSNIGSNYLICKNLLIPNSFTHSLSLLTYDDNLDKFTIVFQPTNVIPYNNFLVLMNMLEFIIKDSDGKTVEFLDESLIIVSLNI